MRALRSRCRPAGPPPHVMATLGFALLGLAVVSVCDGALPIPLRALPRLVFASPHDEQHRLWRTVLLELRLPRLALAIVAGAGLALAGAALQALFRNPLAEPGVIGLSAGAAVGAIAAIVFGAPGPGPLALSAFAGSVVAATACYRLGVRRHGDGLLLAGIAINAMCASMIGIFTTLADDAQLRGLTFWSLGSLAAANGTQLALLVPSTLLGSLLLLREWRALNALLLGEREALHLGFALRALRLRLIVLIALIVGPLVAATGIIAFVGLVVPHLSRTLLGADHRAVLPATLLLGAIALTLADWLARVVAVPAELPIGILTSLLGGPFFLWLLTRRT